MKTQIDNETSTKPMKESLTIIPTKSHNRMHDFTTSKINKIHIYKKSFKKIPIQQTNKKNSLILKKWKNLLILQQSTKRKIINLNKK